MGNLGFIVFSSLWVFGQMALSASGAAISDTTAQPRTLKFNFSSRHTTVVEDFFSVTPETYNAVLSDQFAYQTVTTKSGKQHSGRVVQEAIEITRLVVDPYDPTHTVDIPANEIQSIERSGISPMPPALINAMNADEILDLLAYLLSGTQ